MGTFESAHFDELVGSHALSPVETLLAPRNSHLRREDQSIAQRRLLGSPRLVETAIVGGDILPHDGSNGPEESL